MLQLILVETLSHYGLLQTPDRNDWEHQASSSQDYLSFESNSGESSSQSFDLSSSESNSSAWNQAITLEVLNQTFRT